MKRSDCAAGSAGPSFMAFRFGDKLGDLNTERGFGPASMPSPVLSEPRRYHGKFVQFARAIRRIRTNFANLNAEQSRRGNVGTQWALRPYGSSN